jgi:hypothetical protein
MTTLRTLALLALLALPLLPLTGCGDDDGDDTPPPTPPTDEEVYLAAWADYEDQDLAESEAGFRELLGRGALLPEAHDGLGWVFAARSQGDSALVHFEAAVAAGGAAGEIADQLHAGLAFARETAAQWQGVLDAAGEVPQGWVFQHDETLDRDDVTLLEAVAHYALGDFTSSLGLVQVLDPTFQADVSTAAGRAELANRIEELLLSQ